MDILGRIKQFSLTQLLIAGAIILAVAILPLSLSRSARLKEEMLAAEAYAGLEQILRRENMYSKKEGRFTSSLEGLEEAFLEQSQSGPLKDIVSIDPNKNPKRNFNYAYDKQENDYIRFKATPRFGSGISFYGTLYKDGKMELKGRYTKRQLK